MSNTFSLEILIQSQKTLEKLVRMHHSLQTLVLESATESGVGEAMVLIVRYFLTRLWENAKSLFKE